MNHKPSRTILFLAPLLVLMYLAPKVDEHFKSEDEVVKEEIPSWSELLEEEEDSVGVVEPLPIDTIIDSIDTLIIDVNRFSPSYATHNASTLPDSLKLKGSKIAFKRLYGFFEKLESINDSDNVPLEVFHWGDSQIEGDRISGVLRSSWQKSWGGSGPGLIPAIQTIPSLSVRQEHSGNMIRHTRFGQLDSTITHSAYGPMATFCTVKGEGQTIVNTNPSGFKLNKVWPRVKFYISGAPLGGNITLTGNKTPYKAFNIRPAKSGNHQEIEAKLHEGETSISIGFEGYNLEVTGIELGSNAGVQLHNIPMRGSAGILFTKLDVGHFQKSLNDRKIGLMILQFGGNVVPYIKDKASAKRYAHRFSKQLDYLKSIVPDAAIIVIGPSDMGSKGFYPMLAEVVESLEVAAIESDCLFWDLMSAMGGEGSMMIWSEEKPKLASPDLVHFTPKGARIVGEKFDISIRAEYKSWVEWRH
ncbi:MAG: hypothetical protein CL850_04380 [Crocinitomicaceae bacterium]|nr:hypothetical protein [Crocinitomicaceae bacterium]|tara:strand:+ start:1103 stop:2518 length:1416 start_codon:yes stop_codon:yes gene_type:complete